MWLERSQDGRLLGLAAARFDVFVTADQNLQYQQNLASLPLSVVVLVAKSSRFEALQPLVGAVLEVLAELPPRTLVRVGK